jgi:hypothetical protein
MYKRADCGWLESTESVGILRELARCRRRALFREVAQLAGSSGKGD